MAQANVFHVEFCVDPSRGLFESSGRVDRWIDVESVESG